MKEIIQKWLFDCLGMSIPIENLGQEMKDGVLFAKLLKFYDVVNDRTIKYILSTDNPKKCENNLRQLHIWFQLLGIKVDNNILFNIANGKTSTCIHTLYELFLALHNKERLDFINSEKHLRFLKKPPKATEHCSSNQVVVQSTSKISKLPYQERLSSMIKKQKKSLGIKTNENSRIKNKILLKKENFEKEIERMRIDDITFVQNELNSSRFESLDSCKDKYFPLTQIQSTEEKIHKNIKLQRRIFSSLKDVTKDCENFIMNNFCKVIENREKEEFKKQLSQNLKQQSQYEKCVSSKRIEKYFQEKNNQEKFLEIKRRIEEESNYHTFFSSCKTSEEEINHQIEMIKKMDLHKKLYSEKLKKRYKKHYTICLEIMNEVLDIVIKISNSGKASGDYKWSKWKQIFLSEQPVLKLTESENVETAGISLIEKGTTTPHSEEHLFEEYHYLVGDWMEHAGSSTIFEEQNILGFIIHRLFDIKNPPPFIQKPLDIPKYDVCAILNGIFNEVDLIKLKSLLIKSRICFINKENAIQFCIQCYKNEAGIKDEPSSSKKGKNSAKANSPKKEDSKKTKASGKRGSTDSRKLDKEIQTTSSLLSISEGKELSKPAKIGMYLSSLETLDKIPIPTIVEILTEYLKFQSNIQGWVLVNFPSTLEEAYVIEKTFSGKKFPKKFKQKPFPKASYEKSLKLEETGTTSSYWGDYVAKHSKLIQFPPNDNDNFVTYFSSFIIVCKNETELNNTSKSEIRSGNNIIENLQQRDSKNVEENEIVPLTVIYKEQGILHKFFNETMDLNSLKMLARLILKDLKSAEEVPSSELFGEETLQFFSQTSDSKGKKTPKKTKDDPGAVYEMLKEKFQMDEKQDVSKTATEENIQQLSENDLTVKPGDNDWVYCQFYIPEDMAISLASSWEEMEDNYIKRVKEILQKKMESRNLISPYSSYVSKAMNCHFEEDKESHNIMKKFLDFFNNIPKKKRSERGTQEYLLKELFSLEVKLWELTSKRKNEAEEKRLNLINQNWTADEMIEIFNSFTSLLQVEANRCVSTLHILHNYYCSMTGANLLHFLLKLSLPRAQLNDKSEVKKNFKSTVVKILTDESNVNIRNSIHEIIEDIFHKFQTEIHKLKANFTSVIEDHKECILKEILEYKEKIKANRKKEKPQKLPTVDDDNTSTPAIVEEKYSDVNDLFIEWSCAVRNEYDRISSRIKIITQKTHSDVEKFEEIMTSLFHDLHIKIKSNYLKQNEDIDKICQIFRSAINEHMPVLQKIELHQNFSFNESGDFIETPFESDYKKFEEEIKSQSFTINQLKYILNKLQIISPNGLINKNALLFIIEDLIFYEQDKENINLFPKIWNEMDSVKFEQFSTTVFGFNDLVNWKDFLIYCLELPFPEMEDIIHYKMHFNSYDRENVGIITYSDYLNIKFWYEKPLENDNENLRALEIKQFLFSLFQINESVMNYSEFILKFCKDFNQNVGFGKGLAYFLGQCIIVSDTELYLEDIMKEHREQLSNMVKQILNQIIFEVVDVYCGLTIVELDESPTNLNDQTSVNLGNIHQSLLANKNEINNKENVLKDSHHEEYQTKTMVSERSLIERDCTSTECDDKTTQTVSFSELLSDEYIKTNKILQWASKVPKDVINSLLKSTVYSVLSSKLHDKEVKDISWKLNSILNNIDDEFIYIPWLMNQNVMQELFSYIHSFRIFSLHSIIKEICEYPCK